MKLGTGLFTCQRRPDDDRPTSALYDEMLTLARTIEDAGLDSAWVSEHHFLDDGYLSGTMPALGALAAATDEIEIGSCIALAPLYNAVRLAEDAATVDLVSNGRLTLGLAIGSNPREFAEFGVPQEERVERLADTVDLLRGAWSDGPLGHESPYNPVSPDTSITPKPDGHLPIMLGGAAKPAVRRAARTADGWCAPSSLSVGAVKKRVDDIRQVREKEGLDGDFTVYVLQHGFVGDSREEAWDAMKDGYLYLQRRYAEIFSGESVPELDDERKRELKDQAIFGTPEQVREELETYRDALGDDVHFIFRTYHPGTGTEEMVECIERLGEEVAPELA
ncbi:Flavin-dependent oxidoreductase, luciferase family (includes alkanesulfonate monooxygenase SsuD and methylene tetrahydromethanopterin reductase) [Halogranum gelatinilyticum]|uniref:Flavin-dependent oxidoreductase, luciferase family (Includes alkanesulfonate monooxygenase SsuD and methylene tetrahydromethanopterin reductase) n=1 Tax=Halogranum gelatinilyticum TaxID=660521 RepID=A0A1G9Z9E4_9EURY|nr:LLM class flavin-dependent oxidoreductase [Halogranum gelatinilyticum]SDN17765.1 Flavin-dependent oxidoreductase, luciferase family (includes alkanesulfonate monooxygenase SsuD and methylene tetrahydromethanopterin reductase) [Halogranum gelatinilyticum]